MALDNDDWREIQKYVNKTVAQVGEPFVQGVVVKSDPIKNLIWLKEFGDQPIPVLAFDYEVKYYSPDADGKLTPRKTKRSAKEVKVLCPMKGDMVLVAKHLGSRRLPKCLGVIQSKGYIGTGE